MEDGFIIINFLEPVTETVVKFHPFSPGTTVAVELFAISSEAEVYGIYPPELAAIKDALPREIYRDEFKIDFYAAEGMVPHVEKIAMETFNVESAEFVFEDGSSITVSINRPTGKGVNPVYSGKPLTNTFANSEDPDEMQHNAAFHQGLHC